MEKYNIAAFDFDGTITKNDSFVDFIIYNCGFAKFLAGFIRTLPEVILYLLGKRPNCVPKIKMLAIFFKGMKEEEFIKRCREYSLNRIDNIVRDKMIKKIKWHKEQGHRLVIVSASVDEWIKPWAEENGFEKIIATKIGVQDGVINGELGSENCYGGQKVKSFLEQYPDRESYHLFVYGDSKGDREMLELADVPNIQCQFH
ncbi:MAG: HAD family hydrolase [Deltaproteobacteria bacterium]